MRDTVGCLAGLALVALVGLALGGAVLAYGFVDAYGSSRTREDIHLTAHATSWWGLNYDSMGMWMPIEHGDIFIKIKWVQPREKVLSKLRLKGTAWEGDRKIEDFDGLCQRGSSTDLRRNTIPINILTDEIDQSPTCFIRLKTTFQFTKKPNGTTDKTELERIHARVNGVTLHDLSYVAYASNRPMRFVRWTEDKIRAARDWLMRAISYPFARE